MYKVSSTRFGSTIMNFKLSGELRYRSDVIMVWIETDFPEPVAPAIRRCGALARLLKYVMPDIPLPKHMSKGLSEFWNSVEDSSVPRPTVVLVLFGISIPTRDFPGIGASIRIG